MKVISLLLIVIFLCGCSTSISEICEVRFPEFQAEVLAMAKEIPAPYKDNNPQDPKARTLASQAVPMPMFNPDREKVQSWKRWSRARLGDVQKVMDSIAAYPEFLSQKATLSIVANELVMFYAYAESGKWTRMQESIDVILTRSEAVKKGVCHAAPGEPRPELISKLSDEFSGKRLSRP